VTAALPAPRPSAKRQNREMTREFK
jgi:hypothetical protein